MTGSFRQALRALLAAPRLAAIAAGLALGLSATPAHADDPDYLTFGLGYFDFDDDDGAAEFRLEYRSNWKLWVFKPFSGLLVTSDSAVYPHAGLLFDLYFGNRLVLTPSFAVGYFSDGNGKELGADIEFQSRLELAYRFDNRSRLGLAVSHISNAGIDDVNPGANSVSMYYSVPFRVFTGR